MGSSDRDAESVAVVELFAIMGCLDQIVEAVAQNASMAENNPIARIAAEEVYVSMADSARIARSAAAVGFVSITSIAVLAMSATVSYAT
jgi:hypothetical protein